MRVRRYRSFIRRFNFEAAKRRIPRRATFELTYRCNFKCIHCFTKLESEESELATQDVIEILNEMRDIGVFHITFTGGEIFTRPDILDILGYARRSGFEVSLLTNGSLITKETADWLIGHRIRDLEISFHGAGPETFEQITQIPGSYEKVLDVIKMFKSRGLIVTMKTCVLDLNLDEVDKVMAFAKSLGVSFRYSQFVVPRLDCDQAPTSHRIPPQEFISIGKRFRYLLEPAKRPRKRRAAKVQHQTGSDAEVKLDDAAFGCMVGRSMIFVNPYGQMKPCIILPQPSYDILKGGLKEGWGYMKRFAVETKAPMDWGCKACELKEFCGACPARAYLNTGDMFGCPEYFKEVARLRKEKYEKKLEEERRVLTA